MASTVYDTANDIQRSPRAASTAEGTTTRNGVVMYPNFTSCYNNLSTTSPPLNENTARLIAEVNLIFRDIEAMLARLDDKPEANHDRP